MIFLEKHLCVLNQEVLNLWLREGEHTSSSPIVGREVDAVGLIWIFRKIEVVDALCVEVPARVVVDDIDDYGHTMEMT